MEEFEARSSKKTKKIHISTVISISLILFMIGILGMILVHAETLSRYVKERIMLNVIIIETAQEEDILQFKRQLDIHPYVKKGTYVSKELAARNLIQDLGEDFIKFLGHNPLPSSINVYLKAAYANHTHIEQLKAQLTSNPLIKEVIYHQSLVDIMNQRVHAVRMLILAFTGIFMMVAITLINNMIRLVIHSERFFIKSMQLIGATKSFIRRPFILHGLLHGLLAGLVATMLLGGFLYAETQQFPSLSIISNYRALGIVFLEVIGVGILITYFSTYIVVNRFLRLKTQDLY